MKKHLLLFSLLIFPLSLFAQPEYLERLSFFRKTPFIAISPTNEIWVSNSAGNIYYTKQFGGLWHSGPFSEFDNGLFSRFGKLFKQINFLGDSTIIISGVIQGEKEIDAILRSGDKGNTWEKVVFGNASWIDATYSTNSGKVWMSGNSKQIYYSEDKGKSWTTFDNNKQTGNVRFTTIFFDKDERTGLFGAYTGELYRTFDNCKTWEQLPTPFSQGKYKKISSEQRHDIFKLGIIGDKYIINQSGKVFVADTIQRDWVYQPEINHFEIADNGMVYTINRDLSISIYNQSFIKTWQSNKKIGQGIDGTMLNNNDLYVIASTKIYKINTQEFAESEMFTVEIPIRTPHLIIDFNNKKYGFAGKDILQFDQERKAWYRLMTVDVEIYHTSVYEGKIMLADQNFKNLYSFNPNIKKVERYSLPKWLFSNIKVKSIQFETEDTGCGFFQNKKRIYQIGGNQFVIDKDQSNADFLKNLTPVFEGKQIKQLLNLIEASKNQQVAYKDLNINQHDIDKFKEFIDQQISKVKSSSFKGSSYLDFYSFPGEFIDFNFYKTTADSLYKFTKEINEVFYNPSEIWSTSITNRRIILEFENGQKLKLENADYKPNYLNTAWTVSFEGLKFRTNSIRLSQFIDDLTQGDFIREEVRNKQYAIFQITDYLYRKKIYSN
ncbi:MAG: hypothetical protein EOO99_11780 [Pedobacter sp.]|nr:MAG: hypothetical protein EOO99_11780 [Pedobacter sp.]